MFHDGSLDIADVHSTSVRAHVRNILVYKLFYIGQPYWVFFKFKIPYVHM